MSDLPPAFEELLQGVCPPDRLDAVRASFALDKPVSLRVNPLTTSVDDALDALIGAGLTPVAVPWMAEGLVVPSEQRDALVRLPQVMDGQIYVQGQASWLPVMLLDAHPGDEVLDLAAAPGGKSLHIAACMRDQGRLACVEPIKPRFFRLKANLERGGVHIAALYLKDGRKVGGAVPERFDRVLLDAPCSSEATFRAGDPDSWAHWSPRKVKETSRKQRGLILSAWQALKPGGRMVYATCSLSPEEDELAVQHLLDAHPDAIVVAPDLPEGVPWVPGVTAWGKNALDERLKATRRILPDAAFDAFYVAVIDKPQ